VNDVQSEPSFLLYNTVGFHQKKRTTSNIHRIGTLEGKQHTVENKREGKKGIGGGGPCVLEIKADQSAWKGTGSKMTDGERDFSTAFNISHRG